MTSSLPSPPSLFLSSFPTFSLPFHLLIPVSLSSMPPTLLFPHFPIFLHTSPLPLLLSSFLSFILLLSTHLFSSSTFLRSPHLLILIPWSPLILYLPSNPPLPLFTPGPPLVPLLSSLLSFSVLLPIFFFILLLPPFLCVTYFSPSTLCSWMSADLTPGERRTAMVPLYEGSVYFSCWCFRFCWILIPETGDQWSVSAPGPSPCLTGVSLLVHLDSAGVSFTMKVSLCVCCCC